MKALKYVLVWLLILAIVAALAIPALAVDAAYQPDKDVGMQVDEGIGDTGSLGRQPLLTPEQQKIAYAVAGCVTASAVIVTLLIKKGKK